MNRNENIPYDPYKTLLKAIFNPPKSSIDWPEYGGVNYTQQMVEKREVPEILVLEKFAPWISKCKENSEILFCIIPYRLKKGYYELHPIPMSEDGSLEPLRINFPSEWRKSWGKNLKGIAEFSPYSIKFDSLENAIKAAKQAVEIYKNNFMPSVDGEAVDLLFSNTAIVNRLPIDIEDE